MGKNAKGQQVAISYQAAPGAYYYNTNVFQKYLGIAPSDTKAAQAALSSWSQIEKLLKQSRINQVEKLISLAHLKKFTIQLLERVKRVGSKTIN